MTDQGFKREIAMLIRYAEFVGSIRAGNEQQSFQFVQDVLTPLWTKFDSATGGTVSREISRDDDAHEMPLLLAITYPDAAALEQARACDARFQLRDQTKHLLEMFDGVVYHRATEAAIHDLGGSL
jgi:hypothetical protein